jgi:hypothetical protein
VESDTTSGALTAAFGGVDLTMWGDNPVPWILVIVEVLILGALTAAYMIGLTKGPRPEEDHNYLNLP